MLCGKVNENDEDIYGKFLTLCDTKTNNMNNESTHARSRPLSFAAML